MMRTKKITGFILGLLFSIFTQAQEPGNSLVFDGIDNYVSVPDNDATITNAFTLETWVRWTPNTNSDIGFICGKGITQMEIHTGGGPNALRFIPTTGVFLDASGVLPVGKWTHIAVVYDASVPLAKMYINGEEVSLKNNGSNPVGTALVSNSTPFYIGQRGDGTYRFKGAIDEFRVWNSVRTKQEINADMINTITPPLAGLINYFNFNVGTSGGNNTGQTVMPDINGGGNATLVGFDLNGTLSNWIESYAMVIPKANTASFIGETSFIASWTAPVVGTVENYILEVSTDSAFTLPISGSPYTVGSSELTKTVTGLSAYTNYYYRVSANKTSLNNQGCYSDSIKVTTLGLPVSPDKLALADSANSTAVFNIGGNLPWSIVNTAPWISLDHYSGSGNTTIKVTAQANLNHETRSAILTISSSGFANKTVKVIQAPTFMEPNNALNFDGINDKISVPYSDLNSLYPYTIEMWIRWMPDSINCTQYICEHGNERLQAKIVNGKFCFCPNPGMYFNTNYEVPIGVWTHIAMSVCSCNADCHLYINGEEIPLPILSFASYMSYSQPFYIGCAGNSNYPFKGSIDEFRIFNYQLTQAQVKANMNIPISPGTPGLIHYYKFNNGISKAPNSGINILPDLKGTASGNLIGFSLNDSVSNWVESYAMVAPVATTATNINATGFTANWTAPAVGIVNDYYLYVSTDRHLLNQISGSPFRIDSNFTSKVISGLSMNTTYYYSIRANKNSVNGEGVYSDTLPVVTNANCAITATVNPSNSGTISGTGTYIYGQNVTLTASPNTDYAFKNWTESGTIVSTTQTYGFAATANRNLIANFVEIIPTSLQPLVSNDTTSRIDIIPVCNDDAIYATFRIVNRNDYNVSISYLAGTISGTLNLSDSSSQEINVYKYSICSFFYKGVLFDQIGTNNQYCIEDPDAKYNISTYSIGVLDSNWSIYSITNKNDFNVNIDANSGINTYHLTLPADTVTEIIIPNSDLELVYNNVTFLVHNTSPYEWNATDFFGANVISHTANTITIGLQNKTAIPYTLVLHNTSTGDHIYDLAAFETRNVEIEKLSWDIYLKRFALVSDGYPSYNNNFYLFSVNLHTITATVNPVNAGSVAGAGNYCNGENVTLTATANSGYNFRDWTENGITVSNNAIYSFTASSNRALVANFSIVPVADLLTFSTTHLGVQTRYPVSNVYDLGNIGSTDALTGLNIKVLDDNIITTNRTVIYSASELGQLHYQGNDLWVFVPTAPFNWTVGTNTMTTQFIDQDGNLLNIEVNFTLVQEYSISATVNPLNSGTVSGTGLFNQGSTATLIATANSGYQFVNWTENGVMVSSNATYSFTVNSNRTLVANFDLFSGVDVLFSGNSINIYPNPCNGKFIIQMDNSFTGNMHIKIYAVLGNQQKDFEIEKTMNHFQYFIDLGNIQKGVYYVEFSAENSKVVKKLVIN